MASIKQTVNVVEIHGWGFEQGEPGEVAISIVDGHITLGVEETEALIVLLTQELEKAKKPFESSHVPRPAVVTAEEQGEAAAAAAHTNLVD